MMKKLFLLASVIGAALYTSLPIPLPKQRGLYNPISRLYWCSDRISCIHEIGHKVDQEGGWISHTAGYDDALDEYRRDEYSGRSSPSYIASLIVVFPGLQLPGPPMFQDRRAELYAMILQVADGQEACMPKILRQFYPWARIRELLGHTTYNYSCP